MNQDAVVLISLGSLVIALITMILMFLGQRHTVKNDYVAGLEKRIEALERELATAERKLQFVTEENASLLKKNVLLVERLAGMPL